MQIKNGKLFIYTYGVGGTYTQAKATVAVLDAETGEEKAPISLKTAYNSNDNMQSIAYELDGKIVFTGSTYTTVDLESGDVTCNSPVFEGAAHMKVLLTYLSALVKERLDTHLIL